MIPYPITGSASLASGGGTSIEGYSFAETAGAPARIFLHDGTNASSPVVLAIDLAAGESVNADWAGRVLTLNNGLYVEVVLGTVVGAVYS